MKDIVFITIGGIIFFFFLSFLGLAIGIIDLPFSKAQNQVQMERDLNKNIYNANNAQYNYHWFKERYEFLKATETQIDNADADVKAFEASAGPRKTWTFEDRNEHSRLTTIRTGLRNHYETSAAEYNARAKEADRNIFIDEIPTIFTLKPLF